MSKQIDDNFIGESHATRRIAPTLKESPMMHLLSDAEKKIIRRMVDTILDDDATIDDKHQALATLNEAVFPSPAESIMSLGDDI